MELNNEVARELLSIKAVQIRPQNYFTWTSGIKSPIYCDNRLTMSYPSIRKKIVQAFIEMIHQLDVKPEVIAGCATAGIPHAAWLAEALELPLVYVRSSRKGHGKENQLEGHLEKGQRVVVIEDLISTGGSAIEAAKALVEAGGEVLSVFAIFTYGLEKAKQAFDETSFSYQTITNYDALLQVLEEDKEISSSEGVELKVWREDLEN